MDRAISHSNVAALRETGFCHIGRILPDWAVDDLNGLIQKINAADDIFYCKEDLLRIKPDIIVPIVANEEVLKVAEAIMGPFVQLDSVSLVSLKPNGKSGISWHRDPYGSVPRSNIFEKPLALNLLIYLQDLTEVSGPLRVISGSHRSKLTMTDAERNQPHPDESLLYLKEGEGIIIHNNLVHSRSRNSGPYNRVHLSIIYNLTCMKSLCNAAASMDDELLLRLREIGDPRLLRLFGEDVAGHQRYNAGFMKEDELMWQEWIDGERKNVS